MGDFQFDFFATPAPDQAASVFFAEPELDTRSKTIHETAIRRAKIYLAAEAALLDSILEVDSGRIFEKFGETHLTPYCVKYLGLTADVAANFVRVARRSREVPELAIAVREGGLTVTKAKAIASVITSANKEKWIEKAKTLSKEKLEEEVVKESPHAPKPEKAKAVRADTFRVEFEVTAAEMEMLRRAQDIASQSLGRAASISESYKEALKVFLHYRDPLQKAARVQERNQKKQKRNEVSVEKESSDQAGLV